MRVRKQYGPHAKQCASFTPRPFCLSCLSATHITAKDATRPQKDEKKTEITASHAERVAYSETIASQRLVSREAPDTLKHSPPILAVERVKSTQANQPVSRIHPRGTSTEASETEKREKTEKPTASKTSESRQVKIATLNKWDTSAQTSKAASVTTQEQESPALAPGHSSTQKQTKKKKDKNDTQNKVLKPSTHAAPNLSRLPRWTALPRTVNASSILRVQHPRGFSRLQ